MNPNLPDDPGENGSAAEMDARAAAKFRSRVVETARAIAVRRAGTWSLEHDGWLDPWMDQALVVAAHIESAAAEYLRGGKL